MEYVPGVTLRIAHKRMVARGERLPVTTVLHVMMDVCDALEHVHAAADGRGALGLVHRDISPDNVIISTSGSAKLIDFGAARATARTPPTPVFVGKYRYAAPERIRKAGEDCRSDVYSAGVILYECLAGKRPFDGTDAEVIAGRARGQRLRSARARPHDSRASRRGGGEGDGAESGGPLRIGARAAGGAGRVPGGVGGREQGTRRDGGARRPAGDAGGARSDGVVRVRARRGSGPGADRRRRRRRADVVGRRDRAVRGGDPRSVGADPQARRAPAAARAGRAAGAGAAEAVARQSAARAGAARRGAAISAGLDLLGAGGGAAEVRGWRTTSQARSPEVERSTRERAVALFDRGLELRRGGRYGEALDAWEKALALAPDNRIYQANVQRLRMELGRLRAETPADRRRERAAHRAPDAGHRGGRSVSTACSAWWRSTR